VHFTLNRLNFLDYINGMAFFPDAPISERRLWISDGGLTQDDAGLLRTIRHELGHILGLRHEHIYTCLEEDQSTARQLTPLDQGSIMWTEAICPAGMITGALSRYDALSAWYLYQIPSGRQRLEVLGTSYNHANDYNSDGHADLWWFQGLPAAGTSMQQGQPDGSFESLALPLGLPSLKDMRPFSGHFTSTFGLSQDVMFHSPNGAFDTLVRTTSAEPDFADLPGTSISGNFVPIVGDFDNDTFVDIFWYGPGPDLDILWRFDGASYTVVSNVDVDGYYLPIAGDYDGDNRDDILWYDPMGASSPWWRSTGNGTFQELSVPVADSGMELTGAPYVPVKGDFNGDDRDDIFWYRPGADSDVLWIADGHPASRHWFLPVDGFYRPFTGDFNGDMISDIFWYAPGKEDDVLWYFKAKEAFHDDLKFEVNGDYSPYAADFNGDTATDILWYAAQDILDTPLWLSVTKGFSEQSVDAVSGGYPIGYNPRL
jgi:hypothetical protein